jgi:molybdopterin molybdotransferase
MSSALPSYDQAAALVMTRAAEIGRGSIRSERVDLAAAMGRILAEPFRADRDQPPFSRSTRDGYACHAAEASGHGLLTVGGSTRAGERSAGPVPPGTVWEIMTGAPVPGADAVVMVEHVERTGDQIRLIPPRTVSEGDNIVPLGAEARAGDELVAIGTRLGAAQIALGAKCGYGTVDVFVRPKVAILATGDELVAIDAEPGPSQIRNSNGVMLAVLVAQAGGEPHILPPASDTAESLDATLLQALEADMLLISGGVSAGKFDLVEPALARMGAQFHFTGVRIQPGKPLVFGELPPNPSVRDARPLPFLGLPGNPISSAATFLLFGAGVLSALAGNITEQVPRFALARLKKDIKGKTDLTRFVPAFCLFNPPAGNLPEVAAVGSQGSGDVASFSRSNCFLVVPEGTDRLEAGDIVRILLV